MVEALPLSHLVLIFSLSISVILFLLFLSLFIISFIKRAIGRVFVLSLFIVVGLVYFYYLQWPIYMTVILLGSIDPKYKLPSLQKYDLEHLKDFGVEKIDHQFPRIVHQIFFNYTAMPEHWKEPFGSWKRVHPDWEWKVWSKKMVEELIRERYPWFLDTWLGYAFPINQVDSAIILILHSYGGIYSDMDIRCRFSFEGLLTVANKRGANTILGLNEAGPVTDVLFSEKESPFFTFLVNQFRGQNPREYPLNYLSAMYSTGPRIVAYTYHLYPNKDEIQFFTGPVFGNPDNHEFSMVTHISGGTWHTWDSELLWRLWINKTNPLLWLGIMVPVTIFGAGIWTFCTNSEKNKDLKKLP